MRVLTNPGIAAETAEQTPPDHLAGEQGSRRLRRAELLERFRRVRRFSEQLCETLEPEDYVIQTMPEMSPTKWHLAHTSWFFETFVARPHLAAYRPLNPQYAFLFNSYYNAEQYAARAAPDGIRDPGRWTFPAPDRSG